MNILDEDKMLSDHELKEKFYAAYKIGFAKIIKNKGKKYFHTYFNNIEALEAAIELSIEKEGGNRMWIIPEWKKSFNSFTSTVKELSTATNNISDEQSVVDNEIQMLAPETIKDIVSEEKVVVLVNKYRHGILDEENQF